MDIYFLLDIDALIAHLEKAYGIPLESNEVRIPLHPVPPPSTPFTSMTHKEIICGSNSKVSPPPPRYLQQIQSSS